MNSTSPTESTERAPASGVAVQDTYPSDLAHCYGCGQHNEKGHRIRTFVEGDGTVARFQPKPEHISLPGFVYGGLVASLIDCHAMATASAAEVLASGRAIGEVESPRYVTGSLQVSYLKPTPLGPELVLRGAVRERTERKCVVSVSVTVNGIETVRGEVIAVRMPEGGF